MTKMHALKIRAARALELIRRKADDDEWEKVVEALEAQALRINKPTSNPTPPPWWLP